MRLHGFSAAAALLVVPRGPGRHVGVTPVPFCGGGGGFRFPYVVSTDETAGHYQSAIASQRCRAPTQPTSAAAAAAAAADAQALHYQARQQHGSPHPCLIRRCRRRRLRGITLPVPVSSAAEMLPREAWPSLQTAWRRCSGGRRDIQAELTSPEYTCHHNNPPRSLLAADAALVSLAHVRTPDGRPPSRGPDPPKLRAPPAGLPFPSGSSCASARRDGTHP